MQSTLMPKSRSVADAQYRRSEPVRSGHDTVFKKLLLRGGRSVGYPLIWVTFDRLDVLALDADQPRRAVAARRMQIALIIDISVARAELVVAHRAGLP